VRDPVADCADTAAAWHASWLTALGLRSERRDSVWRALDPPPHIYWTAITLAPEASSSALAEAQGTLCDSWSVLDLEPFGFEERVREPWFLRLPGELAVVPDPAELEIVHVRSTAEVAEFEDISIRGFGRVVFGQSVSDPPKVEPGDLHPSSVLADPRMTVLTGRVDAAAVSAAMSYVTDSAVGIFGVTTIESARGRGYASALTRALIDPALPAVLSPSPEAESLYRRLGFGQVGELCQWHRN
jgi:hypothetical protein